MRAFLNVYLSVAANATDARDLLFNAVPKVHGYFHLALRAFYLNPRVGSTFLDEDFVGRLNIIVHACAFGLDAHRVPMHAADKYRWVQHVVLNGRQ